MKPGYVNEGVPPVVIPDAVVNQGLSKDEARRIVQKQHGLVGLKSKLTSPCSSCGRRICKDRKGCAEKKKARDAARTVMADKYFASKEKD